MNNAMTVDYEAEVRTCLEQLSNEELKAFKRFLEALLEAQDSNAPELESIHEEIMQGCYNEPKQTFNAMVSYTERMENIINELGIA